MYIDERIKNTYRVPQPEGRGSYIRLDQNENPDGIPQWLFDETIQKITPSFLATYPEETALTVKYAKLLGLESENVTLTDGSVVGMDYVIKVFGEPRKKILCVTPSFGMYKVYAEMIGMIPVMLKYEDDMTFKTEKILNAIDIDTSIVVLVNPNMPVGNVYSKHDIEQIVRKADENNSLVIIDEAYYYFYDETSVDLVKQYNNVLVLRTFSKMLSIPALRLGAIIASKETVRCINNYKPHYTVNAVALLFGDAIVENHDKILPELKAKYEAVKEYIMRELDANGYNIIPSYGCFVCIKPKNRTAEEITAELKKYNILILCGTGDLAGYLRLSIADIKYMKIFMTALLEIDR